MSRWGIVKTFAVRSIAMLEVSEMFYDLLPGHEGGTGSAAARQDLNHALTAGRSILPAVVAITLVALILRDWLWVDDLISLLGLGVALFNAWLDAGSEGLVAIVFFMGVMSGLMLVLSRPLGVFRMFWKSVR